MCKLRLFACAAGVLCLSGASIFAGVAQTRPADIAWTATAGEKEFRVPAGDKPSIVLFYRPGQKQSEDALVRLREAASKNTQTLVIISGPHPIEIAQSPYPVIGDVDYAISGKMNVHAWPTTVIVSSSGDALAHIAGVSKSYSQEVAAYGAFFAGEVDEAGLAKRLSDRETVKDSSSQAAGRHLQIAQKLLSRGRLDAAQSEIETGLKLQPDSAALKLALVRVLVLKGEVPQAKAILDSVPEGSAAANQMGLARGRVLGAAGQLDEAIEQLQQAIKLNPNPSEAYYELGQVQQKKGQHEAAAEAYRKAYELSH